MNPGGTSRCLTRQQWASYLEPLAKDNDQWQQHLEQCPACRETLDSLAGDATWWQEAEQWLNLPDDPQLPSFVSRITESVCAMSLQAADEDQRDPLCQFEIQQLQQLLAPASHPELLGRIGRYELEQLVGRGGMGLVFRGRDVELRRVVAVKTLAVHLVPIAAARERFIREARASAALVHPHIVPVYDVITDEAIPALVMQFVAGPTLAAWLRMHGPLPWQSVLPLAIQLAAALAAAHASGLVHRDVKPGNVLLEADGSRALLGDFGLVRTLDEATLTRSGMLTGTPDYMSPEQARGEAVSASSDLFSLGSLLYAMLTGHPPFRASDPMAVMNRICHQRHLSLASSHPEIPLEISRLIDKLLAKEPRRRFHSAEELGQHLQDLVHSPLRLKPARSWKGVAGWVAAAVVLLLMTSWYAVVWPGGETEVQQARRDVGSQRYPAGASATNPAAADSAAANSGFAELRALDASLQRLNQRAFQLSAEMSTDHMSRYLSPSPADPIDWQLQQIEHRLSELEADLSSSAGYARGMEKANE